MKNKNLISFILTFLFFTNTPVIYADTQKCEFKPFEVSYTQENNGYQENKVYIENLGYTKTLELLNQYPVLFSTRNLPTTYTSVDKGYITPVKNQGSYGTCWAFSTISGMETSMIKNGYENSNIDYSELHLSYFAHKKNSFTNDGTNIYSDSLGYYSGGNPLSASVILSSWQGVTSENDFPYPPSDKNYTLNESNRYTSVAHLQEFIELSSNVNSIKKAVMEYGSVSCGYFSDEQYYHKGSSGTSYYYDTKNLNHAVTIVGWDDNYKKENFLIKPSSDGAWLVKNSYGSYWGDMGYFWLSYEQNLESIVALRAEPSDNYQIIHQYDTSPDMSFMEAKKSANIFYADKNQYIDAVGVVIYSPVLYTVSIYKLNENSQTPDDGEILYSEDILKSTPGYYTIDITDDISLLKGDRFSVILTSEENAYHSFESSGDFSNEGESFIYKENQWLDTSLSSFNNGNKDYLINNARIKVFSQEEKVSVTYVIDEDTVNISSSSKNKLLKLPENPTDDNLYFAGWYKDEDFNTLWDFDEDTVTEDIFLFAKWEENPVLAEDIILSSSGNNLLAGTNQYIDAKVVPYYATNKAITWSSSSDCATVNNSGIVTGVKKGTATITASLECGTKKTYTINVYEMMKNATVLLQKPIYNTSEYIYYFMNCENATKFDMYIKRPDSSYIRVMNMESGYAINYTYTPGEYSVFIIAYDEFSNELQSNTQTFWVTDEPTLFVKKNADNILIGAFNDPNSSSILLLANYNEDKLIFTEEIDKLNESGLQYTLPFKDDYNELKLIWINSFEDIKPITQNAQIDISDSSANGKIQLLQ